MLHEKLAQGAAEFGDAPCIIEAETGESLTYAQCLAAVQAVRRLLGLDRPHAVVMVLASGTTCALVWLAALTGGHTLLPLPPDAKSMERERALRLAHPDLLVLERREDAASFDAPHARVLTRAECEEAVARAVAQTLSPAHAQPAPPPVIPPAEGRVCLMTSGSTGEPKGVFLTERQIAWTADAIRRSHQLTRADRGLTVLPLFHVNAPVVSLSTSILAGGSVVIARRFSRTRFWSWIERYQITWASIVPTILAMLLETEQPAFLPGRLRFVRTASAPLPVVHLLAFERRFGIPVVETYGLSEAAATVCATPVPPGIRKPGSVGLPVGVELRICRPRSSGSRAEHEPLVDVVRGESGEICVRGPSVITGYAGGAGASSFQDGWFRTGDLGHQDADGYLYITGRLRDVIIRGGENIAPREIEEVLLAAPLIRDVAVVGLPDPLYGQQVAAYVVPRGKWTPEREQALREFCAERLSAFKIPETFIAVRVLPRTRSGKIQRHRLAGMLSGSLRESVTATVAASVTQTVARLRQVTRPITRPIKRTVAGSSPRLYVAHATPTGPDGAPGASHVRMAARTGRTGESAHNGHNGHNGHNRHNGHQVAAAPVVTNGHRPIEQTSQAQPPRDAAGASAKPRRPYIHELDPIRVITALSVVAVHVLTFSMVLNATVGADDIQLGLGSALHFTREVFMFTTAFVLVYTYAGTRFSVKTFARKRGIGVVVPYVLWSLVYLVINRPGLSPAQFSLAAVKAVISGSASYQLYYILLTIQFYMLFPLLLLVLPWMRKRMWLVLGISCALELGVLAIDYAFVQTPPFVHTSLGAFLDNYQDRVVLVYQFYFVLGAIAALNVDRVRAFLVRWGGVIVVAMSVGLAMFWLNFALAVWWLHQDVEYATSALQPELVPYSLVVLAFLGWLACRWALTRTANGKPRAARFARTLADASFGIYLVHPLFISFAMKFIAPALPTALPVALRVALIWVFVATGSSALSVGLMKTPLLSRLVGRPSALPAFAWLQARRDDPRAAIGARGEQPDSPLPGSLSGAVPDAYATAPVSVVSAHPGGPHGWAHGVGASGRGLAITVTASSARHPATRPSGGPSSAQQVYTRLSRWDEVSGDAQADALANAQADARIEMHGAAPLRARVTVALAGEQAHARPSSSARAWTSDHSLARDVGRNPNDRPYMTDSLTDSHPDASAPQRGPDSRGQREERRRRALALREQGWQRKDIATELGVSRSTVSNWFRRELLREREEDPNSEDDPDDSTDGQTRNTLRETKRESKQEIEHTSIAEDQPDSGASEEGVEPVEHVERASVTANR